MDVLPLRAFRDNYIWVLRSGSRVAVVDPGDADPVLDFLERERLSLSAILITHHHRDHTGGIAKLLEHTCVPVFGPADEPIPGVTVPLREPASIEVPGIGQSFQVISVPGHTLGHLAYYGANVLLCGDTLFGCGCGRLFEGTPGQMWQSLSRLAALPGDTLVYCAHEYTEANIDFARVVEADNPALPERERRVGELRERDLPSVPSTLDEERLTNPFLRAAEPAVAASASRYAGRPLDGPAEVFAALRQWKNGF